MRKILLLFILLSSGIISVAQTDDPSVNSWIINNIGITGRHYVRGNPTPIIDTAEANVQRVKYSDNFVYIQSSGIPSYIVGPYLDGNPSIATNASHLFKIPRKPVKETGVNRRMPFGPTGVFINGVPMYDARDAASYNLITGKDQGGPMGGFGNGVWNRDAIQAERKGFDCAKGHPSPIFGMGTLGGMYHHHQNPSAFNLDLVEASSICDIYLADGLYVIDSTVHSPLIGFAFDGFPVYGAYGYANSNGTGGIKRIKSSYRLRDIIVRTHYANGLNVKDGPAVSKQYPLGHYQEDYEYVTGLGDLDGFNGRFCVTPEYPNGTYAYFATVDKHWNSVYPYLIGSSYYGVVTGGRVNAISEPVKVFNSPTLLSDIDFKVKNITIYPNPATDFIAIQLDKAVKLDFQVSLYDTTGKLIIEKTLYQGSTIAYFDTQRLYNGSYVVQLSHGKERISKKVLIQKE